MENIKVFENSIELVDYISQKYDYEDKLKKLLVVLIDAMLRYYGNEKKEDIFNAFLNTYIHI